MHCKHIRYCACLRKLAGGWISACVYHSGPWTAINFYALFVYILASDGIHTDNKQLQQSQCDVRNADNIIVIYAGVHAELYNYTYD